jgi:hypothetical protein
MGDLLVAVMEYFLASRRLSMNLAESWPLWSTCMRQISNNYPASTVGTAPGLNDWDVEPVPISGDLSACHSLATTLRTGATGKSCSQKGAYCTMRSPSKGVGFAYEKVIGLATRVLPSESETIAAYNVACCIPKLRNPKFLRARCGLKWLYPKGTIFARHNVQFNLGRANLLRNPNCQEHVKA